MAEADALEALMGRLPEKGLSSIPNPRCCCGKTDCAYLRHNCTALDDLEEEVRTAAQLGQVWACFLSYISAALVNLCGLWSRGDDCEAAAHLHLRWTGHCIPVGRQTSCAKD